MSDEKVGIKESKELISGVMVVAACLIERLKDGFQIEDLPVLLMKLGHDPKVSEALSGIDKIPSEFGNLESDEIVQLVVHAMTEATTILAAFKK